MSDTVVETSPDGRYIRYDQVLGVGAFKTVYKAFDTEDALEIAWNKLQVERLSSKELENVHKEVEILEKITHKNIIRFFASWKGTTEEGKQTLDFITELMMSGTLRQYLKKAKAIKIKVLRRWCCNILEAISYLHEQDPPIMHRDIKCDNIFINGHVGEVKIGDLGLSSTKCQAKAYSVIGTPEFMAPELYEESYTEKLDIYAFGMCMLELVTMEYPYSECSNPAQIFKKVIANEKPKAFDDLVDGQVKKIIGACLTREDQRPTAKELLQHPLFRDWESDDGKLSNLSLVHGTPENQELEAALKEGRNMIGDWGMGDALIDHSDLLDRAMFISKQPAPSEGENELEVIASQEQGEVKIALQIPIHNAVKKVEFAFCPGDSAPHIAHELIQELQLHPSQLDVLALEIDKQVNQAQQRHERIVAQGLEHVQSPTPPNRSEEQLAKQVPALEDGSAVGNGSREWAREDWSPDHEAQQHQSHDERPNTEYSEVPDVRQQQQQHHRHHRHQNQIPRTQHSHEQLRQQQLPQQQQTQHREAKSRGVSGGSMERSTSQQNRRNSRGRSGSKPAIVVVGKVSDGSRSDHSSRQVPNNSIGREGNHVDHESARSPKEREDAKNMEMFRLNVKLMEHCAEGRYTAVKQILEKGASPMYRDFDKRTPLHIAASEARPAICDMLLKNGASTDVKDRYGKVPIDYCREGSAYEDVISIFEQHGITVPEQGRNGRVDNAINMEMMHFCSMGNIDRVREKLMAGASVGYTDDEGRTALHLVCAKGHIDLAELLLLNGANVDRRDRNNFTPVDDAIANGYKDLLQVLRQYGADLPPHLFKFGRERQHQLGVDLIDHSARGEFRAVKSDIQKGANVNFHYLDRRTALHSACANGHILIVDELLNAGANLNAKDRWGSTPQEEAACNGHKNVVDMLYRFTTRGPNGAISTHAESREQNPSFSQGTVDRVHEDLRMRPPMHDLHGIASDGFVTFSGRMNTEDARDFRQYNGENQHVNVLPNGVIRGNRLPGD